MVKSKQKKEKKSMVEPNYNIPLITDKNTGAYSVPKSQQYKTRQMGFDSKIRQVNSDFVFTHKDFKKNTKGYDKLTGEISKRGRPADDQSIFMKKPEADKTFQQLRAEKEKSDAKRREALNKKLYKERLKTKWDRGW